MPGPFSYLTYLKHQLRDDTWADEIMVCVMSMMWQITITVVHAESLFEHRIRHDRYLRDVDLVLVFCGNCHYVGACKYSFSFSNSTFMPVVRLTLKSVRQSHPVVR